jgi:hypothetical protein
LLHGDLHGTAWISFGIKNAEELPNRYPAYHGVFEL